MRPHDELEDLDHVIVTKFREIADHLIREGYVRPDAPVYETVSKADIRHCIVWGYLPMRLAAFAARYIEVTLPGFSGRQTSGHRPSQEEIKEGIRIQGYRVTKFDWRSLSE